MNTIALSMVVCVAAFCALVWLLRRDCISLGLPIAYLFGLLLIHLPGAYAHLVQADVLADSDLTELGIGFTAIGSACFVLGVWLARVSIPSVPAFAIWHRPKFALFCLVAGWTFVFALSPLNSIPSLGATIDKGGTIWMLGVMLGLRSAMKRRKYWEAALWLGAVAVYPLVMLLLGGFLSYGAQTTIIVLAILAVAVRSPWRAACGIVVAAVVGLNIFVNYFLHRSEIRDAVWGGYGLEQRVDAALIMVREFEWLDTSNEMQILALDERLNQNYFVGLAAHRIEDGDVDYLYGRSLEEGLIALVPRIVWPNKPVSAGSGHVVIEMTGLNLAEGTSFGVGNVMEFQINFGVPGVIVGFLVLGGLIGSLDRKAAAAEISGDLGRAILFFLPAVALIQPNGSLVELASGSAAAVVAAYGWKWGWKLWSGAYDRQARAGAKDIRRIG